MLVVTLADVKVTMHNISNQGKKSTRNTKPKMESKESVKVEEQWSIARMAWEGLVLYEIQ